MTNTPLTALFLGTISLFLTPVQGVSSGFGYPPDASLEVIQQRIAQAPKTHPRLFANGEQLAELRKTIQQDPIRQGLARAIIHRADQLQDVKPITHTLQGRRLLDQSRRCVARVTTLAMAFHLTEDEKYVRRCQKEMLAAARMPDWNPSHFLDVAEMTFAMAVGYDWLFKQLDADARNEIRSAIVKKGVELPLMTRHRGWVRASNNWGQVCHGGLTAGALAVLEDEPKLAAQTVQNALQNVTRAMAAYAPNGSYPEGPGYWAYGTTYNVLLIAALESVLNTDFGLCKAPGFSKTGQFVPMTFGPSGLFFNYADGGARRGAQPALLWLASRFKRPDWLLGEAEQLKSRLAASSVSSAGSGRDRALPLALLWLPQFEDDTPIQMPLHWSSEGHVPITIHRSSWTDPNATFVGLKAGSPAANHGQMDIGSFVLDADGVRWAMDLGAEGYYGIESRGMNLWDRSQDSDRWTIFRQSNYGHNTLVIDDQLQVAAGQAKVIDFSDDAKFPHSVIDMTSVYKNQAKQVLRGVALLPSGEVLIQDQLTGLKPGSRVRWGMITPGTPGDLGQSELVLRQGKASLGLAILSPQNATWEKIDTAKPRHEWDSPNRGTCMVAFQTIAPNSGELTYTVLATPGTCAMSIKKKLILRPVSDWHQ